MLINVFSKSGNFKSYSAPPQHLTRHKVERQILHALAQDQWEPSSEGAEASPDID
jgi:hypothetical protein